VEATAITCVRDIGMYEVVVADEGPTSYRISNDDIDSVVLSFSVSVSR